MEKSTLWWTVSALLRLSHVTKRVSSKAGNAFAVPLKTLHIEEKGETTYLSKVQRAKASSGRQEIPPSKINNLVLMLKYNDTNLSDVSPLSEYEALFNKVDGPDGKAVITESIKSYDTKVSSRPSHHRKHLHQLA